MRERGQEPWRHLHVVRVTVRAVAREVTRPDVSGLAARQDGGESAERIADRRDMNKRSTTAGFPRCADIASAVLGARFPISSRSAARPRAVIKPFECDPQSFSDLCARILSRGRGMPDEYARTRGGIFAHAVSFRPDRLFLA